MTCLSRGLLAAGLAADVIRTANYSSILEPTCVIGAGGIVWRRKPELSWMAVEDGRVAV